METAKDLKQGDFFRLKKRKNGRIFSAHVLETVTGKEWQNVIDSESDVKEGYIFTMGMCGTQYGRQLMMPPETEVFIVKK